MDQCGRIRLIIQENKLKQRQFAAAIGVTEGYVSKLLREPDIRLSQPLAALIESRYGYSARWVLTGEGPKQRPAEGAGEPSPLRRKVLARLEGLDDRQLRAVLAFLDSLEEVERCFSEDGDA